MSIGQVFSGYKQNYTIEKPIGESSGMGEVFVAKDQHQKPVVLKFAKKLADSLDQERHNRLKVEAKIVKDLTYSNNPNTVQYVDEANPSVSGDYFLAMQFLNASHIDDIVEKRRIPEKETIDIAIKILQAIDGLHKRNAIHRDIKPENIMIEKGTGTPILIDFGTAKMLQTQSVNGTMGFMSHGYTCAHQMTQKMQFIKPDCDLYALGRVMFYMLTGVKPAKLDKDGISKMSGLLLPFLNTNHKTTLQPYCSRSFQNILEKLLDPDHPTYHTATQIINDLKTVNSKTSGPNHIGGTSPPQQFQNPYITLAGSNIPLEKSWKGGLLIGKEHPVHTCQNSTNSIRCNSHSEGYNHWIGHTSCKCKGGTLDCALNPRHFVPKHHMRIWYNNNQKNWMIRTHNQGFGKAAIRRGNDWNVMDHDVPYTLAHNDAIALIYVNPPSQIPITFFFYEH